MIRPPLGALAIPPWMRAAMRDLDDGVREVPGGDAHPEIRRALAMVGFGSQASDEIPNCAAMLCKWVEDSTGLISPRSGLARAWSEWGVEIPYAPLGAIVVLSRGSDPRFGHVTLWGGAANLTADGELESFLGLGANQRDPATREADQVCWGTYEADRIVAVRWPAIT